MVSAVSDFTPKFPQIGKIKKVDIGDKWSIEMKQNPDILKEVNKDGLITIGFKAEMDKKSGFFNAESILKKKNIEGVCYNLLEDSQSFGTTKNSITFITEKESVNLGTADKLELSFKILGESQKLENE
jgi:phosphopantothenoylcysteine decarboxylase/phosphopantothenate--cysteine ligase